MLSRSPQIEALAKSVRRKSWKLQAWVMQKMHWNQGRIYIHQVVHLDMSQSMEYICNLYIYLYVTNTWFQKWKNLPSRELSHIPPKGKGKSSTEKCRLVYLSSQEGNISVLQKKWLEKTLEKTATSWLVVEPTHWKNMKNLEASPPKFIK